MRCAAVRGRRRRGGGCAAALEVVQISVRGPTGPAGTRGGGPRCVLGASLHPAATAVNRAGLWAKGRTGRPILGRVC